jgi:lathosterol oxidase
MYEVLIDTSIYILQLFAASAMTTAVVCTCFSQPFYNPSVTLIPKMKESVIGYAMIFTQASLLGSLVYPYLDAKPHSLLRSASNLAEYSIWIEVFYYTYHRWVHTPMIYKWVHAKHHANTDVYPLDTIQLSFVDSMGLIVTVIAPMWFVQVDKCEFGTIMYMYLTGAFLSHSNILWNHHSIHHREFKYNYCFLFPIFDILCGTYRE